MCRPSPGFWVSQCRHPRCTLCTPLTTAHRDFPTTVPRKPAQLPAASPPRSSAPFPFPLVLTLHPRGGGAGLAALRSRSRTALPGVLTALFPSLFRPSPPGPAAAPRALARAGVSHSAVDWRRETRLNSSSQGSPKGWAPRSSGARYPHSPPRSRDMRNSVTISLL